MFHYIVIVEGLGLLGFINYTFLKLFHIKVSILIYCPNPFLYGVGMKNKKLNALLKNTLSHINGIEEVGRAEENLLGAIAQDIQKWYGITLREIS